MTRESNKNNDPAQGEGMQKEIYKEEIEERLANIFGRKDFGTDRGNTDWRFGWEIRNWFFQAGELMDNWNRLGGLGVGFSQLTTLIAHFYQIMPAFHSDVMSALRFGASPVGEKKERTLLLSWIYGTIAEVAGHVYNNEAAQSIAASYAGAAVQALNAYHAD